MTKLLKKILFSAATICALITTFSVQAATVLYDEALNGELPVGSFDELQSFNISASGTYKIKGNFCSTVSQLCELDPSHGDAFSIHLNDGYVITSMSLVANDVEGFAGYTRVFVDWIKQAANDNHLLEIQRGTDTELFSGQITEPIHVGVGFLEYELDQNTTTKVHYVFSFEVQQPSVVPLPAAFPLFGAALSVLGFLRLKRKSSAA